MKKHILNIIFALCITYAATAQNTGFGGKRVLFKTNLVNGTYGFCNTYQAEIAFHRQMTLSIGYDLINTNVKQSYDPLETTGNEFRISPNDAQTTYNGYMIEFRKYFSNGFPAPYGLFVSASYGNGNLNIEKGSYDEKLFIPNSNGNVTYSLKGISVNNFSLSFGYQLPLNKWLFIGGQLSGTYFNFSNIIEGLPQNVASGVLKNYGPNIINFTPEISDGAPIDGQQKRSFGISGVIQLGFMLF